MATTTVQITVKPDKGKFSSLELRNELDNIDALADMNGVDVTETQIRLDTDYDDDARILVAEWTV
jgi:hypothetical protein